jgi:hypothetical protein
VPAGDNTVTGDGEGAIVGNAFDDVTGAIFEYAFRSCNSE